MISIQDIRTSRILIVDDLEANVLLLRRMLVGAGYSSVACTSDPREVCALHREHVYDLILLDLEMPGMDGFQVMEGLREIEPEGNLPVLVLTAQPRHKLRALTAGARDFVSKPFDLAEVLMRVQNSLEARHLYKKLVDQSEELRVRNQFIQNTFGRYLSHEIVDRLLAGPHGLRLGGERRRVTLMITDMRGYTALSERLPPESVVALINNYLEKMIEIVLQHGGMIDDFTGDGILGIFGVLVERQDDARRAVACAVTMQLAMVEVNATNHAMGLPATQMGIGLNTGDVVVGNIGSLQRTKYGVVGSNVNLTSRIESYTTGGQIMISQSTLDAVGDYADVEERLYVQPKGMSLRVPIYSVVGIRGRPDLALSQPESELMAPVLPLGVSFAVLNGLDASGEVFEGRVIRLSRHHAEIEASHRALAFANLKLQFVRDGGRGALLAGDVYAKVGSEALSCEPGVFLVRFTSVPPDVMQFMDALREAAPARAVEITAISA